MSKLKVQDGFHAKRLQNLWPLFERLILKVLRLKWFMELLTDYDPAMYCSSTVFRYHFPTKVFIGMQWHLYKMPHNLRMITVYAHCRSADLWSKSEHLWFLWKKNKLILVVKKKRSQIALRAVGGFSVLRSYLSLFEKAWFQKRLVRHNPSCSEEEYGYYRKLERPQLSKVKRKICLKRICNVR